MRKFYYAAVVGLLFIACNLDNDEMELNNDQIQVANSILEVDGCVTENYNISDEENNFGEVKITNDLENIYVNFLANTGFKITGIMWELADTGFELPINNGGIIPGQLTQKVKFTSGEDYYGSSVPLSSFNENCIVFAARVSFKNSKNQAFHIWAENTGNQFLDYCICVPQDEPICTISAGRDIEMELTFQYVDDYVEDLSDIRKLLLSLLDEETQKNGIFSPDSRTLRDSFAVNPYQTFRVEYTVFEGDCTDSAVLWITIIP